MVRELRLHNILNFFQYSTNDKCIKMFSLQIEVSYIFLLHFFRIIWSIMYNRSLIYLSAPYICIKNIIWKINVAKRKTFDIECTMHSPHFFKRAFIHVHYFLLISSFLPLLLTDSIFLSSLIRRKFILYWYALLGTIKIKQYFLWKRN